MKLQNANVLLRAHPPPQTPRALGAILVDNSKQGARDSRLDGLHPASARLAAEIAELKNTIAAQPAASSGASVADFPSVQMAEKSAKLADIDAQITQIEASRSAPVSAGFISDILSDAGGISFHRFQMLAWTAILGLVFIYSVWERLAMPEFSATLLLGISAGSYRGFKVPEKEG